MLSNIFCSVNILSSVVPGTTSFEQNIPMSISHIFTYCLMAEILHHLKCINPCK